MKTIFSLNPLPLAGAIGLLYIITHLIQPQPSSVSESSWTKLYRSPVQRAAVISDSTKLYIPDELEATLWAESPLFYNPTSLDVDIKGRIWITEAVNYRKFMNKSDGRLEHPEGERIMILEDTNGDGKADNSKVFVQDPDLVSPLGIAVVGNKVIVSCSPNLIVYTDTNGDDVPDKKEVMLTGFGGLDHDHALHSMVVGPDDKYYFNVGNAGPHVVADTDGWTLRSGSLFAGGSPHNKLNHGNQVSDDGRVWVGGMALRINPDGSKLKVMGHNLRNSYETALDSYGNMWLSDNDDEVAACRTGWLMEGANAGYFSADGTRTWKADQRPNQSVPMSHWHQDDPGVLPLGELTGAGSPTGMVMCESDELGPQYRGMLLGADAGRNVIAGFKPDPSGAGYRLTRTDLISTLPETDPTYKWNAPTNDTRKWFRPSDVAIGTDGALYITDWYDPVVGGHQMQDKKGYGRIYRITPKGKNLKTPKLDLRTTQGQIAALLSPAINVRALGFEALREQGEKVVEPVMALLTQPNQYYRARAIFLLAQLGAEGQFEVERLLKAVDAPVRLTALRALRSITPENSKSNPGLTASQRALLPLLGNLSVDRNAAVRREVAVAVRDIPYDECRFILLNLMKGYDGQDRWYLNALGEAADGKEEALFFDLRQMMPDDPSEWDQRTANLVWELHPASAVNMLKKRADNPSLAAAAQQQAITTLGFIKTQPAAKAMLDLSKSANKEIAAQAMYWLGFRRDNDWAKFLNWNDVALAKTAMPVGEEKTLAKRQLLLDATLSETEKRKIAVELSRDAEGAKTLIGLAADNLLSEDLIKAAGPGIRTNKDLTVRALGKEYFPWKRPTQGQPQSASAPNAPAASVSMEQAPASVTTREPEPVKTAPVSTVPIQATPTEPEPEKPVTPSAAVSPVDANSPIAQVAMLNGDGRKGQVVFQTNCASCHRYAQQGADIGPDLTHIHQKFDKNGLLDAIIYPNSAIAPGYEPWMITTKKGQTFYGFLISDNDQTVTVKGIKGYKHTVPTNEVFSRRQYKNSLMPDPTAMKLTNQQLADLTAYLLKQ